MCVPGSVSVCLCVYIYLSISVCLCVRPCTLYVLVCVSWGSCEMGVVGLSSVSWMVCVCVCEPCEVGA